MHSLLLGGEYNTARQSTAPEVRTPKRQIQSQAEGWQPASSTGWSSSELVDLEAGWEQRDNSSTEQYTRSGDLSPLLLTCSLSLASSTLASLFSLSLASLYLSLISLRCDIECTSGEPTAKRWLCRHSEQSEAKRQWESVREEMVVMTLI